MELLAAGKWVLGRGSQWSTNCYEMRDAFVPNSLQGNDRDDLCSHVLASALRPRRCSQPTLQQLGDQVLPRAFAQQIRQVRRLNGVQPGNAHQNAWQRFGRFALRTKSGSAKVRTSGSSADRVLAPRTEVTRECGECAPQRASSGLPHRFWCTSLTNAACQGTNGCFLHAPRRCIKQRCESSFTD